MTSNMCWTRWCPSTRSSRATASPPKRWVPSAAATGVFIRDGVVLTIGYLITEAETIWLTLNDGPGGTGHGAGVRSGDRIWIDPGVGPAGCSGASAGRFRWHAGWRLGRDCRRGWARSIRWRRVSSPSRNMLAIGNIVVDEAIFTAPAHPNWGGTAMIGAGGELLGIGSLQLQQAAEGGQAENLNMIVPIDLLEADPERPNHHRSTRNSRRGRGSASMPPNPMTMSSLSAWRPRAGAARQPEGRATRWWPLPARGIDSVGNLFRKVWSLGSAGVEIPLTIKRDGRTHGSACDVVGPQPAAERPHLAVS